MGGILTLIRDLWDDLVRVIRELVSKHGCGLNGCDCDNYSDIGMFKQWLKKAHLTTYANEVLSARVLGKPFVCDGCGHARELHGSLQRRLVTADVMPNGGVIFVEMQARAKRAAAMRRASRFANDARIASQPSRSGIGESEGGVEDVSEAQLTGDDDTNDGSDGRPIANQDGGRETFARRGVNSDDSHTYGNEVRVEDDNTASPTFSSVAHRPSDKDNDSHSKQNDQEPNPSLNRNTNIGDPHNTENAAHGRAVQTGDRIRVHYQLLDGKSMQCLEASPSDEPLEVKVGDGSVVPGFEIGLLGAKCGVRRRIAVPSHLAYSKGDVVFVVTVSDILP